MEEATREGNQPEGSGWPKGQRDQYIGGESLTDYHFRFTFSTFPAFVINSELISLTMFSTATLKKLQNENNIE